jgi:hypothetical protein
MAYDKKTDSLIYDDDKPITDMSAEDFLALAFACLDQAGCSLVAQNEARKVILKHLPKDIDRTHFRRRVPVIKAR